MWFYGVTKDILGNMFRNFPSRPKQRIRERKTRVLKQCTNEDSDSHTTNKKQEPCRHNPKDQSELKDTVTSQVNTPPRTVPIGGHRIAKQNSNFHAQTNTTHHHIVTEGLSEAGKYNISIHQTPLCSLTGGQRREFVL